jgi:tetratricopeptide (TPR) repeat protein
VVVDISHAFLQAVVLRDTAAARRSLAALEATQAFDSLDPVDRPYTNLVAANVRAGNVTRAKQLLADYERVVPKNIQRDSTDAYVMQAYVALGERRWRDAVTALRALRATSGCRRCGRYEEGIAWEQLAQPDSARAAYETSLGHDGQAADFLDDALTRPQVHRQLGTIYEAKGERSKAVEQYTAFLDLWRKADPELQPQVREVKERLSRLVGEGAH